jgi:hypothetical protein
MYIEGWSWLAREQYPVVRPSVGYAIILTNDFAGLPALFLLVDNIWQYRPHAVGLSANDVEPTMAYDLPDRDLQSCTMEERVEIHPNTENSVMQPLVDVETERISRIAAPPFLLYLPSLSCPYQSPADFP